MLLPEVDYICHVGECYVDVHHGYRHHHLLHVVRYDHWHWLRMRGGQVQEKFCTVLEYNCGGGR